MSCPCVESIGPLAIHDHADDWSIDRFWGLALSTITLMVT